MRTAPIAAAPLALLALLVAAPPAPADEVVLRDGTRLEGHVIARDEDGKVTFQTAFGPCPRFAPADVRALREDPPAPGYLRFTRYNRAWSRLEVLCRTFRSTDGARTITLAGAVHIADLAYYRRIQAILDAHDVVLYEGVGAPGSDEDYARFVPAPEADRARELARPFEPQGRRRAGAASLDMLTRLQLAMGESLDLTFQHEGIDYGRSWWKAADVTVEELKRMLDERGQNLLGAALSSGSARMQAEVSEIVARAMAEAAASVVGGGKPLDVIYKETFARILASQVGMYAAPGADEDAGSPSAFEEVLIVARNKVVARKLHEVLQAPGVRSVAIFYGAGHGPDLERRIAAEGFRAVAAEWLPAWEIRAPGAPVAAAPPPAAAHARRAESARAAAEEAARTAQAEALYRAALARLAAGDTERGAEGLDQAIALRPADPRIRTARGAVRARARDYAAAIEDFDEALRSDPGAFDALIGRGEAREALGDAAGALADGEAAVRMAPQRHESWATRGFAREVLGDRSGAIADYGEAVARAPRFALGWVARGRLRALAGDAAGAAADFRRAEEADPENGYAALWLAGLAGDPSGLAAAAARGGWLGHVARFMAGEESEADLLAEAERAPLAREQAERRCEAHCYAALAAERAGDRVAARRHYAACVETGVRDFVEYVFARARLAAMPAPRLY
jgi:tetratricopeptide (TPR) repeat protein